MLDEIFRKLDRLGLEKESYSILNNFDTAFVQADEIIVNELIPCLEAQLCKQEFEVEVFNIYVKDLEEQRLGLLDKIDYGSNCEHSQFFYQPLIDLVSEKMAVNNFQEMRQRIDSEFDEYRGTLEILDNFYKAAHGVSGAKYFSENYIYYRIGALLYMSFYRKKETLALINQDAAELIVSEYQKIDIDIAECDSQFSKYKLLSLNDHISINNYKDSQTVVDARVGKHFWISVPRRLLSSIEDIIRKKYVRNISFRVSEVTDLIPIFEEMEFGSKLGINIESLPEVSKFYSAENFDNKLWVTHDKAKKSITFEEHVENFELLGDDVATQLVHLEYSSGDNTNITHIDHEIIIYTLDQYVNRVDNHTIKGYKKIKSFKIDGAEIPFNYEYNGELFLVLVLDAYFKNKDLIDEYFNEMR